jgi:hypothetical protein
VPYITRVSNEDAQASMTSSRFAGTVTENHLPTEEKPQ